MQLAFTRPVTFSLTSNAFTGRNRIVLLANNFSSFFSHGAATCHYQKQVSVSPQKGSNVRLLSPLFISFPDWEAHWQFFTFILLLLLLVAWILYTFQQKWKDEKVLHQVSTSLFGKSSIDDIFWEVANQCTQLLNLEDCVVYQYDQDRQLLVQRAAAGPKNPNATREILNQLEIPLGKGIVGATAATGKSIRIGNTSEDQRYILDDQHRYSELSVPIWVDGTLFGVLDTENSRRYFFTSRHERLLKNIANLCGERISKYLIEERLRSKISRDLHDEIGSTLTSINILSTVAITKAGNDKELSGYLQKIKEHSGTMMDSMSDMIWAINPANDRIEKVLLKMKEFAAEMLEPCGIQYHFETSGVSLPVVLNLAERKDLYLVYKEAITNIVKYSHATQVNIVLTNNMDKLSLSIIDNGIGFDNQNGTQGNGLKNMETRARDLGAKLEIQSQRGTGTSLLLIKQIT